MPSQAGEETGERMAQDDRLLGVVGGAAIKIPVKAASTGVLVLTGAQTVDGVALVAGDRCLVKNQASGVDNGIYVVDSGAWSRAKDFDGALDVVKGTLFYITNGTVSAGLFYTLTTADPITIGTTALSFSVVSPSSPLTLPLAIAQGGTGQITKAAAAAAFGVVSLTGAAGTANAQTAGAPSSYTAFGTNDIFPYTPSVTNAGPTNLTITPSGGGALAAKNVFASGAACHGGELIAGVQTFLLYDGVNLNIIGDFFRSKVQENQPVRTTDWIHVYSEAALRYRRLLMNDFPLPRSYLAGYGMANGGDAVNDIDVAAGSCRSLANTDNILLAATMTKQLDVAWAVGTNQGGRATGVAIANGTYHVFVIKRPDTGVIDVAYDSSATGANIATNTNAAYTEKRRIGSILREGGSIVAFTQLGEEFLRKTSVLDVSAANPGTGAVARTLSVPTGIQVWALANWAYVQAWAGTQPTVYISELDKNDEAPLSTAAPLGQGMDLMTVATGTNTSAFGTIKTRTSTAAQVRSRLSVSDANVTLYAATLGWIDQRGRDD
jgi:hypothetical protein